MVTPRIFVNRSLALEKIKCFGFDTDYTLASAFWGALKQGGVVVGFPQPLPTYPFPPCSVQVP